MADDSKSVDNNETEKKNIGQLILPFLNQYYYKTTYVFNNITFYKNDILLDFILSYGVLRIANILLNNPFNNTFFFGIIIFYIYIWEHWFILSHHSDLVGFPELINWLSQIVKYGSYILMIYCIRDDILTEAKPSTRFLNFFVILSMVIRLYCLLTYLLTKPGPKYLMLLLPVYTIISMIPLVISFFFKKDVNEKYVMYYTAFIMDIVFYMVVVFIQSRIYANLSIRNRSNENENKYPIFNKKNWIERFSMLTLLIIVFPITYIPSFNFSISFHDIIYTLICGTILVSIGYIYNSVNSVLAVNHALNLISPFFGCVWRVLHLPLHLGLSLVGLSLSIIIKNIYVYRNYPNNTYDETLSPTLPTTYYSGLEIFYQTERFQSTTTTVEENVKHKKVNLGKAIHSIDEIKALLAIAFLLTFVSVFFMKFLHRYSTSTVIDNPKISDNPNNQSINDFPNMPNNDNKAKKTNDNTSTKSKEAKENSFDSAKSNIIKSSEYFPSEELDENQANKNKEDETTKANTGDGTSNTNTGEETSKTNTGNETTNNNNTQNNDNTNMSIISNEQLKIKKANFYKLKQEDLKTSIMDLANNKQFADPKAQDIINKCSNDKIANNISEMNNNAVITTYINSTLTLHSFFIFLFQVLLVLLFLVFNYIKIPISILLILTLIIVEIELLTEIFLPRILKITNKRKNIKILPTEKPNDAMDNDSNSNFNNNI